MTTHRRTLASALLAATVLAAAGCQPDTGSGTTGAPTGGAAGRTSAAPAVAVPDAFPSTARSRAGTDPGPKQNTGGYGCDLEPHGSENFTRAAAGTASTITAAAEFSCAPNAVPIQLSQSLMLEYQGTSDTNWQLMSSDPQFYTAPPYRMLVAAPCQVGDWRLRVQADGIDAAKQPIHIDYAWPPVFVSTCP